MQGVLDYVEAVLRHWTAVLVTWLGGLGLITGASLLGAVHWPGGALLLVVVVGLEVAQYRAWREQARTALGAERLPTTVEHHYHAPVTQHYGPGGGTPGVTSGFGGPGGTAGTHSSPGSYGSPGVGPVAEHSDADQDETSAGGGSLPSDHGGDS